MKTVNGCNASIYELWTLCPLGPKNCPLDTRHPFRGSAESVQRGKKNTSGKTAQRIRPDRGFVLHPGPARAIMGMVPGLPNRSAFFRLRNGLIISDLQAAILDFARDFGRQSGEEAA